METEISIMHPEIILYSIIIAGAILLVWRRRKKFKKGVIVANTKYVKKTKYFKILNAKYHVYNIIIKVLCILIILTYAVITARLYNTKKHEEEFNNRDIMLCMDFSPSVKTLNRDIVKAMIETVKNFKDERIGVTIFDSAPITLIPLTTDYEYVLYTLDLMEQYLRLNSTNTPPTNDSREKYLRTIFTSGVYSISAGGTSLIGDGLAACAMGFKEKEERTKVIILSTDNMVSGTQIVTVPEAAAYAKEKGIKVYPIGTTSIRNTAKYRDGLIEVANVTGGVYHDYGSSTVNDISNEIEKLNKTAMVKTAYVTKKEYPEILVPYLLYLVPILLLLDWRVRI